MMGIQYNVSSWKHKTTEFIDPSIDSTLQKYTVQSNDHSFSCIPSETSNKDIFCLTHPHLNRQEINEIWEYYRELFIRAKFKGVNLSHFRQNLSNFVTEQRDKIRRRDPAIFDGTNTGKLETHHSVMDKLIRMSLWLELQYRVDTVCDQLSEHTTIDKMTCDAKHLFETVKYNNYVSYYCKSETRPYDPADYANRKLFLKNVFSYTHKDKHYYMCKSEYGAVELKVESRHNPFIPTFDQQINEGVEINVVNAEMRSNISNEVPVLVIKNWFVE